MSWQQSIFTTFAQKIDVYPFKASDEADFDRGYCTYSLLSYTRETGFDGKRYDAVRVSFEFRARRYERVCELQRLAVVLLTRRNFLIRADTPLDAWHDGLSLFVRMQEYDLEPFFIAQAVTGRSFDSSFSFAFG